MKVERVQRIYLHRNVVHSNSQKLISIRFHSIHTKKSIRNDSNRFNSSGEHSTVEWWKVGGREGQMSVLTLIFPVFVPAAVASTVKYCIQTLSCGRIEWSNFLGNRIDSNRFVVWIESNRFESRIGMHYPGLHAALHSIFFLVGSVKLFLFLQEWRFSRSRSSKVIDLGTNRKRICDFRVPT